MVRAQFTIPVARIHGLVINDTEDGVLVYDLDSHHIHHLNLVSAAVWRQCTGEGTVSDLARATGLPAETVQLALTQLQEAGLLDATAATEPSSPGNSRRSILKKAGVTMAVPAILSLSAATASAQTSGCLTPSQCNRSTVGQKCATNPANCATSPLACWPQPGAPGMYFCGSEPD